MSNAQPSFYVLLNLAGQQTPSHARKFGYGGLDFLAIGTYRKKSVLFVPDSAGNFIDVVNLKLTGKPFIIGTSSNYLATAVAYKPPSVP